VNHIVVKGHTFFPWNLVGIRQRPQLFPVQSNINQSEKKKIEQRRPLHGKALSPLAPPLACPKNHHKKLDKKRKKIDKNGTFILQHCPVNQVTPFLRGTSSESDKGHTFFPSKAILKPKWKKIEQRRPLHDKAPSPSEPPLACPKNRTKKALAWAKHHDLQHRR